MQLVDEKPGDIEAIEIAAELGKRLELAEIHPVLDEIDLRAQVFLKRRIVRHHHARVVPDNLALMAVCSRRVELRTVLAVCREQIERDGRTEHGFRVLAPNEEKELAILAVSCLLVDKAENGFNKCLLPKF